jgi:SAM-dependent methyltransferase
MAPRPPEIAYHARSVARGLSTLLPALNVLGMQSHTGHTSSARYCYSVWNRHIARILKHRPKAEIDDVAELGPGPSVGTGLAAVIGGAASYVGLDVVPLASVGGNLQVFDELIGLYARRAEIPDDAEMSEVKPPLQDGAAIVQTERQLQAALKPERLAWLRASLERLAEDSADARAPFRYLAPWQGHSLAVESADLVISQAVLEHVDDLDAAWSSMERILRPGGLMSHQIDFRSHGHSAFWNGHWAYGDSEWAVVRGRRPFLLNREPASTHLKFAELYGLKVVAMQRFEQPNRLSPQKLAPRYRALDSSDAVTSGIWLLLEKE